MSCVIDIESQTVSEMRKLTVVYYDTSDMLNRTTIKRWLSDLEKLSSKCSPDFIVLKNCCRYITFELHRKEWCKYYFLSSNYEPNQPIVRSHLVLSRYPFVHNENISNNTLSIIKVKIPFNDVPMRYEYEDLDVQQINVDDIVIVVDAEEVVGDTSTSVSVITKILNQPNPNTILYFGNNIYDTLSSSESHLQTISQQQSYFSEAWKYCKSETNETNPTVTQFEMINYE